MFAKLIGHNPEATTAISWIKSYTPLEVHTNELERFLILEGSCDITIGTDVHSLKAGDFYRYSFTHRSQFGCNFRCALQSDPTKGCSLV